MLDPPSRIFLTDVLSSLAGGSCGTTATRFRPRSGETPSHWWTTGQSTPYAPQACITIDRSVYSRSMLAPKSGLGAISGIMPGISQTSGSSCTGRCRSCSGAADPAPSRP